MPAPKLDIHQAAALALYEQRNQYLNHPLVAGQLLATTETTMLQHLHVLSQCQHQWPDPETPGHVFLQTLGRLQTHDDRVLILTQLEQPGVIQQALCDALCWQPEQMPTATMVEYYQHHPALRPLLFDLWRHRRDKIPPALTSSAELRGKNIDLQTAALRYAASRTEIGHELFLPYFRDLTSASNSQIPGKLLATALWGSLLRGTGQLYEPLWRGIENETDSKALYRLLRIGALIATPELPDVIRQYAKKSPAQAAELLALHGTRDAIDTLADLVPSPQDESDFQAAWLWVSGQQLYIAPRLRVVGTEEETTPQQTAQDWWHQQRAHLTGDQRLLFGHPLSLERLRPLAGQWGGRYSINLLDLLASLQKKPVAATERIPLQVRRQLLEGTGGKA